MYGAFNFINQEINTSKLFDYIKPIIQTVDLLNKEALANMAETLVSLFSIRKQVTSATETIGEPVDIAVITKGDGFILIKRKHYFEHVFNQYFFDNYYRD